MPTETRRPRGHTTRSAVAGALAAFALATPAAGVGFEDLLSPGELATAHADLDGGCGDCHQAMKRESEKPLCLACHEEVQADLRDGAGFHGRDPAARDSACRVCHPEHRGRGADLLGLGRSTFDHERTDFPLAGGHARVECGSCHAPDERHREAPSDCVGCHRDDDPHRGTMGLQCGDCHEPAGWGQGRFDHATTGFALEGRHAEVVCGMCHGPAGYEGAPTTCGGCHAVDDAHAGRLGDTCGDCHSPQTWATTRFDHARDAGHPLRGAHRETACEGCHVRPDLEPAKDCNGCHAPDDVHRGSRGTDCQRCHGEDRWQSRRFDHAAEAGWPLHGRHADSDCAACHVAGADVALDRRCRSCHAVEDVHAGQLGDDCAACHTAAGWVHELAFDHDLGPFPLLGLHAMVACEECHGSARFHDTASDCASCHRADDVHERRLGPDCGRCHNPNGWPIWHFDHTAATRFALEGRHTGLRCEACHRQPVSASPRLASDCQSCHRRDDPHRGGFGAECQRCHSAERWSAVHFGLGRAPVERGEGDRP